MLYLQNHNQSLPQLNVRFSTTFSLFPERSLDEGRVNLTETLWKTNKIQPVCLVIAILNNGPGQQETSLRYIIPSFYLRIHISHHPKDQCHVVPARSFPCVTTLPLNPVLLVCTQPNAPPPPLHQLTAMHNSDISCDCCQVNGQPEHELKGL